MEVGSRFARVIAERALAWLTPRVPSEQQTDDKPAVTGVRDVTPTQAREWLDRPDSFVFLDVRTPQEREIASVPGFELFDEAKLRELERLGRDTPLVLMCHHGIRSRAAGEYCVRQGFQCVYNVAGGIDAWSLVDSSIPRY